MRVAPQRASRRGRLLSPLLASFIVLAGLVAGPCFGAEPSGTEHEGSGLGEILPVWSVLPFLGMLLSIALFPLVAPHFWHRHYPKVSFAWALILAAPFVAAYGWTAVREIEHILAVDYVPFIILLWALFTVSGGILVEGRLAGTPLVNTGILFVGTVIASWVGTTGAAMLLIRPLLRANSNRKRRVHLVVFFIFLVANIGGALTPLGDPPLLLGFLHGVPFFWTMKLLPAMSFVSVVLLVLFYVIDRYYHRKEDAPVDVTGAAQVRGIRVRGTHNFLFLAGIVVTLLLTATWHAEALEIGPLHLEPRNLARNAGIGLMGILSLVVTPRRLRKDNEFTWEPMREVALLFLGIFVTMVPALAILRAGESGPLGFLVRAVREPWHYYWVTGVLSSFLDNAPTYLTFFNTQLGRFYPGQLEPVAVAQLITEKVVYLKAISMGAVFMGANTYIGNAPNFMVKSIAEEVGVPMPSFFGYLIKWAVPILIPLFVVTTLIFF